MLRSTPICRPTLVQSYLTGGGYHVFEVTGIRTEIVHTWMSLESDRLENFVVVDLSVGHERLFRSIGAIPASLFTPESGINPDKVGLKLPQTFSSHQTLRLTVANLGDEPATINADLLGYLPTDLPNLEMLVPVGYGSMSVEEWAYIHTRPSEPIVPYYLHVPRGVHSRIQVMSLLSNNNPSEKSTSPLLDLPTTVVNLGPNPVVAPEHNITLTVQKRDRNDHEEVNFQAVVLGRPATPG